MQPIQSMSKTEICDLSNKALKQAVQVGIALLGEEQGHSEWQLKATAIKHYFQ